jgi:hypothetical protein
MIVIIGLLLVIAAAGVATAGVATNSGGAHSSTDSFVIFGQSLSGLSTGQLFLFGIVVGVIGTLGLAMLLGAFNRRLASRSSRRELTGSRREGAALRLDRDRLTRELDDVRRENLHADVAAEGRAPDGVDAARTDGIDTAPEPGRPRWSGLRRRLDRTSR